MALKTTTATQFPFFTTPQLFPSHHHRSTTTEIRFSRWNNANAQKYELPRLKQKELEDQLRFHKRHEAAHNISQLQNPRTEPNSPPPPPGFKSAGTPSAPSRPSIPGKKSKYSKPDPGSRPIGPIRQVRHPAFVRMTRLTKVPKEEDEENVVLKNTGVNISDNGISYVVPEAPFEFRYSYTETPRVKPVKLREPPVAPFGPGTMPRPWTGRKPLPSGKKIEFDSFQLPPPHKKGVKPVQAPGPFLAGSGPKYVKSREEILGEPLTKEEVVELVRACRKAKRQLNMGRDGLTHNMLDNIHAHWKRRRVCKIRCLGVCTVDMDNVRQQLEEKTGGKVIQSQGGIVYLFRGRNYNYKSRPVFPLMLWKPITPVYPRLVKRAPEGLTLEEASEMRKKGRELIPICKLGKNGVYCNLVADVREAFEACELVRINCQGMNGSDYRKIGAKLKDLVPCVLISFEREHILIWRGRDWKSSLFYDDPQTMIKPDSSSPTLPVKDDPLGNVDTNKGQCNEDIKEIPFVANDALSFSTNGVIGENSEGHEGLIENIDTTGPHPDLLSTFPSENENANSDMVANDSEPFSAMDSVDESNECLEADNKSFDLHTENSSSSSEVMSDSRSSAVREDTDVRNENFAGSVESVDMNNHHGVYMSKYVPANLSCTSENVSARMEGVKLLLKQAVEGGSAIILDESCLDADIVRERAVALAQSAPPGPVFKRRTTVVTETTEKQKAVESEVKVVSIVSEKRRTERSSPRVRKKTSSKDIYLNVATQGSLRVDELAKLLA